MRLSPPPSRSLAPSLAAARAGAALPLLLLALAGSGQAAVIDVGTGTGCESATIEGAVSLAAANGSQADTIRLSDTVSYAFITVTLTDIDPATVGALTISGGWADCLGTSAGGPTSVSGFGGSPLITVRTDSATSTVRFQNLRLAAGGPALLVEGASDVEVVGVTILASEGGVEVRGGADVELSTTTSIHSNTGASFGGGVHCTDAGSSVTIAATISGNEASFTGGGVFADDGCVVRLRPGALISGNEAERGGGIAVQSGAKLEGGGAGSEPTEIVDNIATVEGGGIFMKNPGPLSLIANVRIDGNVAGQRGGGVSLGGEARLQLERFNFELCASAFRCMTLSDNSLSIAGPGSAASVDTGAELRMMQGFIEGNGGADDRGSAIYATGVGSSIVLDGVQIWNNRTSALLVADDEAEILAGFVSAARNSVKVAGTETYVDSQGAVATDGGDIWLQTSILTDHGPFAASGGGTIIGDCLMADTITGLATATGEPLVGIDPRFVAPDSGDLHLRASSPAIDSCDNFYPPLDIDLDLEARGFDLPSKPNVLGPFDRGADEVRALLFSDGFESGGTAAWSSTS